MNFKHVCFVFIIQTEFFIQDVDRHGEHTGRAIISNRQLHKLYIVTYNGAKNLDIDWRTSGCLDTWRRQMTKIINLRQLDRLNALKRIRRGIENRSNKLGLWNNGFIEELRDKN